MHNPYRGRFTAAAVLLLLVVAVLGYVAGHRRSTAAPVQQARPAFAGRVVVEYPSGWQRVAAAPEVPGLTIGHPVAFAPDGNAAHAGLITGQLPGGEPAPLPAAFLARLGGLPQTAVVDFVETEAYRYSQLSIPGFGRMLTLYVIPSPGGDPAALACYASPAFAAYMRTCEQIVATLSLAGQQRSYELTPDAGYAGRVSALVGALDRRRLQLRRQMSRNATLAAVQSLAGRLADTFAAAAASLAALEAPAAVAQAQAALSASLLRAHGAYTALAAATQAGSLASYEVAQKQVYAAEASVDAALESFALLGYPHR